MKLNRLSLVVAIAGGLTLLTGCTKSLPIKPEQAIPVPPPSSETPATSIIDTPAPVDSSWTLRLKSECGDTDRTQCIAGYGFSVDHDGQYALGPGPQGEIRKGSLSQEEIQQTRAIMDNLQLSGARSLFQGHSETCVGRESQSDLDSVTLIQNNQERLLTQSRSDRFCYALEALTDAEALQEHLRKLSRKYYSTPFPDACLDLASKIEQEYTALLSCTVDTDCAYVDVSYSPVAENEIQFIYTDMCSVLKPLAVANRALLSTSSENLVSSRERLRDTCGERIVRESCAAIDGFQASEAPPVCEVGVCRTNPIHRLPVSP